MKFSALTAAFCLVATAFSSPVAQGEVTKDVQLPQADGVESGLLANLAPSVVLLVSGLGLAGLAPGLSGLLTALSTGLKRELPTEIPGLQTVDTSKLNKGCEDLSSSLKIDEAHPDGPKSLDGMSPDVLVKVVKSLTELNKKVSSSEVQEADGQALSVGLLAMLAPPLAGLVTALGLGTLAPGLVSLLTTLSAEL